MANTTALIVRSSMRASVRCATGLAFTLVVGSVATHKQVARFANTLQALFFVIDYHKGLIFGLELLGSFAANPAKTADNEMLFQLRNAFLHRTSPASVKLIFDQILRQRANQVVERANAHRNQHDCEQLAGRVGRAQIAEAQG